MKLLKNRFLFIILISIATLAVLVIGALTLYKDTSAVFASDGYILETTTKTNNKYYFSANTKYKENVDNQITFSDNDSNTVAVDPASFVHYLNGNVSFLQKGALVNLADITSPMVSYYNITTNNTIVKDKEQYTVTSNDKKINIESFVGRINDNKYLIAGNNVSIKIPKVQEKIPGEYFEILYIEEGIVKIDNQEASYQVTAQDSYVYVGDNITISLVDGKIYYDGEAKMLLSQITINNNENINLDVEDKNGAGGGKGSGSGTGEGGEGAEGDGTGEGSGDNEGASGEIIGEGEGEGSGGGGSGSGDGTGEGSGDGTGEGSGGSGAGGTGISSTTASPRIDLIEAIVTSTKIDLSMQLNNATLAQGPITAYLTNIATGKREYEKNIELVNGTFKIIKESLSPSTEYALTIVEKGIDNEKQYFQKTFKTKDLGLTLEKVYATEDSLAYKIIFEENTEVTMAHISIFDNNGSPVLENELLNVSKNDLNNTVIFEGLESNTSYSVNIDKVWINNAAYSSVYTINRIDTTLKKTPRISGITVDPNAEEVKFTINLDKIEDKDKSIISYTYNIYLADDITLENENPEIKYSVTKNDADALVLNLNEINELKTGVDYRCKIIAQYHDNEMIRTVSTDYSGNFLIKSKPKISFELKSATMNRVEGVITLLDANCTVPINGRSCSNSTNNFTLRYYKLEEEETTENDRLIGFDSKTLKSDLVLEDLASNTTYAVKAFGNYYDDDNVLHANVQIGDAFYVTTDKSDNLYFEIVGDNKSGQNKDGTPNSSNVVTFDARLTAPQNSTIMEEISTITLNLYSGRYNVKEKLIGTYQITDNKSILDFFNNLTITNKLFTDTTKNKIGKIDTLEKLIKVTNNSNKTLTSSYTVEVEDVYDSSGINKITVENNVYTFNLTSAYYLDARIETNPKETYITATPITKENLTEEEYEELSKTVKNLDDLNDDTVVGLIIENSLSDIFVDSAFTYEKAIVNYTIYNQTTKQLIKTISVDMGNKYQPKTQTVYLDSSELDDGKNYFTRGYKYKIGFNIDFITEDGANPNYTNDKLYKVLPIERQAPIYTQYISSSNSNGITYRYSFRDIDNAIANKNFYYTIGEIPKGETPKYQEIKNTLIADKEYHEVTVPLNTNTVYSLYYPKKNTDNLTEFIAISTYDFETEYSYNEENAYTIINDNDNTLKLRLENNDVTNRAVVYKVEITTREKNAVTPYIRYFLASKLSAVTIDTGKLDEEGKPIVEYKKYIAIDYANISRFMGYEMNIKLYSYYDSGLVGLDQNFTQGAIFKNRETGKYLNIYNSGSNTTSTAKVDNENMGIYLLKEPFAKGDTTIYLYNHLRDTATYNPLKGTSYIDTKELASNIGIEFNISHSNAGFILTNGKTDYVGYNARVLKEANLNTNDNTHKFNTIIPSIKVTTNTNNTINSIRVHVDASGIYGNKQFVKNGQPDKQLYIEFYSDEEAKNKLTTVKSAITINGSDEDGYTAEIADVEYKNLIPATKYYFKIFGYIDGKYTQLYDSSTSTSYISKIYESTTLDADKLLDTVKFEVVPKRYNGETSEKELTWKLNLTNTENYKVRFELYEPNGTTTTIDPETGEEKQEKLFKPVNFNGTAANGCDTTKTGTASDGYINNCYILVPKDKISTIDNKDITYKFSGNDFVFGGNYYKLVVYAIPFTNNKYDEENKVILYQNDSLTTQNNGLIGNMQIINIPELREATFKLNNTLTAGHTEKNGYYISFKPEIIDEEKVIKYGTYTITLKNEKGELVKRLTDVDASEVNKEIRFNELSSNTLYYIELSYETYRNNVGYSEFQKTYTTPFTDFIYTPIDAGITLGTITAGQSGSKGVILTYNGSTNLSQIVRVFYTISLKGGSSKATGNYVLHSGVYNPNTPQEEQLVQNVDRIFEINTTDGTPKLMIDTSDSQNFSFRSGNTYIITTQYYYLVNGKPEILTDKETGNSTHTTILNL